MVGRAFKCRDQERLGFLGPLLAGFRVDDGGHQAAADVAEVPGDAEVLGDVLGLGTLLRSVVTMRVGSRTGVPTGGSLIGSYALGEPVAQFVVGERVEPRSVCR